MNIGTHVARMVLSAIFYFVALSQPVFASEFDDTKEKCKKNPVIILQLEAKRAKLEESLVSLRQKQSTLERLSLEEAENLFQGEIMINDIDEMLIRRRYGQYLCEELQETIEIIDPKTISMQNVPYNGTFLYLCALHCTTCNIPSAPAELQTVST
jgi:septal ring factor EnvC (AmiA/AmiB activator)